MKRAIGLLLALALLSGCWSRREITETSFIGLLAVDWVNGRYRLTANGLLPANQGSDRSASGGGGTDPEQKPIWTIQAEAPSLDEAMGRLERLSPRRIFLGHLRAVLFGEAMARRGIGAPLGYLDRSSEVRPTVWLGVTPGLAGPLLTTRPVTELYPANGPLGYHDLIPKRLSMAPARRLVNAIAILQEEGADLVLPMFRMREPEGGDPTTVIPAPERVGEMLIGGAGVFRGERLVGWLTPEEGRGLLFARSRAASGPIAARCPQGEGQTVFRLRGSKTKLILTGEEADDLAVTLLITAYADLNDVQCDTGPASVDQLTQFEEALAGEIEREVRNALQISRRTGADIFNLGQALFQRNPPAYKALARRWPEVLARIPVEIQVQTRVPRVGQIYNSMKNELESSIDAGGSGARGPGAGGPGAGGGAGGE